MICYASSCRPGRNIDAIKRERWRLLFTPFSWEEPGHSELPYCLDSGAWTAFQKKQSFDEAAFEMMIDRYGRDADFVVLPDVVAGGLESLALSIKWICRAFRACERVLLPVQNGMNVDDVRDVVGGHLGIFIGGDTEWKLRTMETWSALARERRTWCHVGRVNSAKRIKMCAQAGIDSIDGTSATRFSVTTPRLARAARVGAERARQQQEMFQ